MLPIQLELKNFLAYSSPQPLVFDGIHLACLSGANGAGKSSILDAITWALWGKARARSDDDLIHMGHEEMSVSLDFWQGETRYKVVRKRKRGRLQKSGKTGAGSSELALFAHDPATNRYNLIGEGTLRETQTRIIELLALDYDTFVNSAFLQQGQADAFTIKTPAHRKEILGEILGLNRWSVYEESVKIAIRQIDEQLRLIEMRLAEFEIEAAKEPTLRIELKVAHDDWQASQAIRDAAQARYDELAGVDKALRAAQSEYDNLQRTLQRYERDMHDANTELANQQHRLEEQQAIIANREAIEAGYNQWQEAEAANQALADILRRLRDIDQHINTLEGQIRTARQDIELEVAQTRTHLATAEQQMANLETLQAEFDTVLFHINELEAIERNRDSLRETINHAREHLTTLRTQNQSLHKEMLDIKKRVEQVETLEGETTCPYCGQPLSDDHRLKYIEELTAEGTTRGDKWRENKAVIAEEETKFNQYETTLKEYTDHLTVLPSLQGKMGGLHQQLSDAQAAQQQFATYQAHLDNLVAILAHNDYAHELQAQLAAVQAEREQFAYNPDEHDAVREALDTYRNFQDQAKLLEFALQNVDTIAENMQNIHDRITRWQNAQQEAADQMTVLAAQVTELQTQVVELNQRNEELIRHRTQARQAEERYNSIQQQINSIEAQRQRLERDAEREVILREEQAVYDQLRKAFSKDGVPAMLIDAAIPELEETANALLRKMSNGRMTVRFDTQREKKTGGVAETFDIWISDELGTRDYSLYSGGEAFRVNFAIRVAISQLLARRAGAQLRTLFIDEGFGTQDEAGRSKLVEAINAVQDDFDLILVITHIDELRDAFPVRIEIEKHPDGSQIMVL